MHATRFYGLAPASDDKGKAGKVKVKAFAVPKLAPNPPPSITGQAPNPPDGSLGTEEEKARAAASAAAWAAARAEAGENPYLAWRKLPPAEHLTVSSKHRSGAASQAGEEEESEEENVEQTAPKPGQHVDPMHTEVRSRGAQVTQKKKRGHFPPRPTG